MTTLVTGLALALVAAPALAAAEGAPATAAGSVRDDTFPQVEAAYPGGVVARPHVEFANYVGYRPLQLDLYLHADRPSAPPRPLVIWIHGGGWSRGDARQSGAFRDFPAVLAGLAARGYVVAAIDYRLAAEARFPAQIEDVKAAIRFLRAHAGAYGIDPSRVVVWGGSAGGHLAALAATSCGYRPWDPPASTGRLSRSAAARAGALEQSDCVMGAVAWYGVHDLSAFVGSDVSPGITELVEGLLGCRGDACKPAALAASPVTRVDERTPPMLLIHGLADTEVPPSQTWELAAAMRRAGRPVEVLLLPGVDHGLIANDPALTRHSSLEALERTEAWLDALMATAPKR